MLLGVQASPIIQHDMQRLAAPYTPTRTHLYLFEELHADDIMARAAETIQKQNVRVHFTGSVRITTRSHSAIAPCRKGRLQSRILISTRSGNVMQKIRFAQQKNMHKGKMLASNSLAVSESQFAHTQRRLHAERVGCRVAFSSIRSFNIMQEQELVVGKFMYISPQSLLSSSRGRISVGRVGMGFKVSSVHAAVRLGRERARQKRNADL